MVSEEDKTQSSVADREYPCLELLIGPGAGKRYPLHPGKNFIGRLSENDIVLDDSSISRRHAMIQVTEGRILATDQGSRNGTRVGGNRLATDQSAELLHQTRLRVGAYEFRFLVHEAPPASPEETKVEETEAPQEEAPEAGQEVPQEIPEGEADSPEASEPEPDQPRPGRIRRLIRPLVIGCLVVLVAVAGLEVYQFLRSKKKGKRVAEPVEETQGEMGGVLGPGEEAPPQEGPRIRPFFLDFSHDPIPAKVFFGNEEIGLTPFRVSSSLEEGKSYEARAVFQLPELEQVVEQVVRFQATPGAEILPIVVQADLGIFKVASLPGDAQLYLEGYFDQDPTRARPVKFAEIVFGKPVYVPFGRYLLTLQRSRQLEGSQTFVEQVIYRREFFLKQGESLYTLDVKEGDLQLFPVQINSIPSGAKVFVDDAEVGVTPFTGTLTLGEHKLLLRAEGFFDYTQAMKSDINTSYVTEIQLQTSAAGEMVNRATQMIRENRHQEALPLLVEAFRQNPSPRERAEISYLIGICYLWQKSYKDAQDYFNKAAEHPELKFPARLGLANITYLQGDSVKALQLLVDILIQSENPKLHSDAGILFQQISPLKSVIYVASEPAGAYVFVNGQQIPQLTPIILHDLGVGTYRIEIKKGGFLPSETKLNIGVSEFRPVLVRLDTPPQE